MPIARVQLEDGRIAKLDVPEGASEQDIISFAKTINNKPKQSSAVDIVKTAIPSVVRGITQYGMTLPSLVNAAFEGPQLLGRGIADTIREDVMGLPKKDRGETWKPFFEPSEVLAPLDLYQPKTTAGKVADFVIQAGTAVKADSAIKPGFKGYQSAPKELPVAEDISRAAKLAKTKKSVNPITEGIKANLGISERFSVDKKIQQELYDALNRRGQFPTVEAQDMYSNLSAVIEKLSKGVAQDSSEYRALMDLADIKDNLLKKYPPTPKFEMGPVGLRQVGFEPRYVSPSDLVEIKAVINTGLKPNKFTSAGAARLNEFKSSVSGLLDSYAKADDVFGELLKRAENQTVKLGAYKEDVVRQLWQPEDYLAYNNYIKSGSPLPSDTLSRAEKALTSMQSSPLAKSSALYKILPKEMADDIIASSIALSKQKEPTIKRAAKQLVQGFSPARAAVIAAESVIPRQPTSLEDLVKSANKAMSANTVYPSIQPPPNSKASQAMPATLQSLYESIYQANQNEPPR